MRSNLIWIYPCNRKKTWFDLKVADSSLVSTKYRKVRETKKNSLNDITKYVYEVDWMPNYSRISVHAVRLAVDDNDENFGIFFSSCLSCVLLLHQVALIPKIKPIFVHTVCSTHRRCVWSEFEIFWCYINAGWSFARYNKIQTPYWEYLSLTWITLYAHKK